MDSSSKFGLAFFSAVLFHLLILALFILGISLKPEVKAKNNIKAMQATVVDANQAFSLKSEPTPQPAPPAHPLALQQQKKTKKKLADLPKQQAIMQQQATTEAQLAEADKIKTIAKKKALEQEKLLKKIAEQKKAKAAEKIRQEKLAQPALQLAKKQKKTAEAEQAQAKEKRLKKDAEQAEKLAKEQQALRLAEAEQEQVLEHHKQAEAQKQARSHDLKRQQNETLVKQIAAEIARKVKNSWIPPVSITHGLSCTIRVKLNSNGAVTSARAVSPCSGDELFKRSAENAVNKASPLPVPSDSALFDEYFKVFKFNFAPE
jgi:colicin import membrane protein